MNNTGHFRMEWFGGESIYMPQTETKARVNSQAEKHLRANYAAGQYTDREEINRIIHHLFAFYEAELSTLIPQLASRSFMEFILHTYDKSSIIEQLDKDGRLSPQDSVRWHEYGPILRRAIKYLAECSVQLEPMGSPNADKTEIVEITDRAICCSLALVVFYQHSDMIRLIDNTDAMLTIHPHGVDPFLDIASASQFPNEMAMRVQADTLYRKKFIHGLAFIEDPREHEKYLAEAFKSSLGLSYQEVLGIIIAIMNGGKPPTTGFPISFCNYSEMIRQLSQNSGHTEELLKRVIDGFVLSQQTMASEGRRIWKPKQEYRSYRRGFYEMPHQLGQHLMWSGQMAKEAMVLLICDMVFKKIPPEWKTRDIDLALERLSNEAGRWFEKITKDNLDAVGFHKVTGIKCDDQVDKRRLSISQDIGEIDLLCYSPSEKLLAVIECKLVRDSTEAKYFRDDLAEFVTSSKSYYRKFRRKIEWVRENISSIKGSYPSLDGDASTFEPTRLAVAMITYYPSFASFYMPDLPCVSIAEFRLKYEKYGRWPFAVGVYNI